MAFFVILPRFLHLKKDVQYQESTKLDQEISPEDSFMHSFENVTVAKKANIYYDGKVTSRTIFFPNGEKKTLGIMMPGAYEFGTDQKEIMEILSGELKVLLPNAEDWIEINGAFTFEVPAHEKFKLRIDTVTDYCCSYIPN